MARIPGSGRLLTALAVVLVGAWLGLSLFGGREPSPGEAGTSLAEAEALEAQMQQAPPGDFALDARRANWPPLDAAGAGGPDTAALAAPAGTVNYYVVLDGSGSMRKVGCSRERPKIEVALAALEGFIGSVPPEAHLGLAVFDENGLSERVALGTGNRDALREALTRIRVRGGTPLRSAIELGYQRLTAQGRRQLGYGEYHLVVVTDGKPEPDSEDPREVVDRIIRGSPVVLHTIGFCIGTEHVLNQPGRTFYTAADSPESLQQGLSAVLAEAPAFDAQTFSR